jgi:hypothetical protein
MKRNFRIFLMIVVVIPCNLLAQTSKKNTWESFPWWKQNNLRVIQTNLPDYEAATLNPDSLVKDLVNVSANTLIINAGGIMAFYPTKLDFHYRNPYMKPLMLGDVVTKCHAKGIRVIVRFDFSRIHESIYRAHPDWAYISPKGERMINRDMYVVSINAPYVQDRAFRIVSEVLDMYDVDGIFLNMPGYQVNNPYEGKYHGIDQNEADKKAFTEFSGGLTLPLEENRKDSVYLKYLDFKIHTGKLWSEKLYDIVKKKNDRIAICTYTDQYVDIIRHESQTNTLPYWPYNASDNVANAMGSYPDHIISNASIQQISFQSRFNAVEPEEVAIRLYENIANGSGLDMSMMGDFRNYEDERNFEMFKKVYGFHKKNEVWYGNYSSLSSIAVIAPGSWPSGLPAQEYRGIQLMLKESHIPFDIIEQKEVANRADALLKYKLIIMPDITGMGAESIATLKTCLDAGVNVISTNQTLADNPAALKQLFSAAVVNCDHEGTGNYIEIDDYKIFKGLSKQKILSWKFNMGLYDFSLMDEKLLPLLSKSRPGPPEIIGGHEFMGFHAIGIKKYPKSSAVLFPSNIGRLYYMHGYEQYKILFLDLLKYIVPDAGKQIQTNAPPRVEVILKNYLKNIPANFKKEGSDGMIMHLVNLTGFSGNSYFDPITIAEMDFKIKSAFRPAKVFTLTDKKPLLFTFKDGYVSLKVKNLRDYEAVVFSKQ